MNDEDRMMATFLIVLLILALFFVYFMNVVINNANLHNREGSLTISKLSLDKACQMIKNNSYYIAVEEKGELVCLPFVVYPEAAK